MKEKKGIGLKQVEAVFLKLDVNLFYYRRGDRAVNAGDTSLVSLLQAQLPLPQVGALKNIPLSFSH